MRAYAAGQVAPSPGTQVTGTAIGDKFAADVNHATLMAGEDQANDVIVVEEGQYPYQLIAASSTAAPLGSTGAAGDLLSAVIVKANTGTITILDGATTVLVIPASTAVGTRFIINAVAATGWKITTPASTEAIAVGRFT